MFKKWNNKPSASPLNIIFYIKCIMVYLEINKKNYNNGSLNKLNKYLSNKRHKIFILFYMEGCMPCMQTRPEWTKLKNVLSKDILHNDNIIVVSIDKDLVGKLKNIKSEPSGFPTMRFITNAGEKTENYEDSGVANKDRKIDSFVEWITLKSGEKMAKSNKNMKNTRKINKRRTRNNRKHNRTYRSHNRGKNKFV
jgi:hypothetical protein